ncbi:ABC transporter ATP-binding protein [Yersinia pestis]|uniref:ABC transport protein n=8 Tax=Yersinia pseudotuberculosis complex TaxID=1649845 RepID=A0AAX2I0N6_YERPE|nr:MULTISPECIES: ABC transporter ATP-binding protein [Yersinia pseudotuberculosis complex]EDR31752.1 iron chelate ABC transporter (FeCT) family, ATP-binding protein [Yersinia pestis biovar Orientalis str. IP275]EFA46288.1 ABC transporter, ATP-binding protein [Yersinia pestis KIM D27]ERP75593.1 iron ABC transporter ATP-binding protein [Yersinia pestis S3]ERP76243.1 iron ABC transporter ATP-binding protein [Yersinia pestis 24H]CQD51396.1 putative transport ATP-binding protein [Yersinia intermedi
MTQLTLKHVGVTLHKRPLLTDISLTWPAAQVSGIIGPNGAGKSTLLKAINHMVPITGQIEYQQCPLNTRVTRIAYVSQLNRSDSALTVFEMVLLGKVRQLSWRVSPAQIDAVEQVLAECGISSLANQVFNSLSGGQRQLVMLAQAFIAQPQIILLDEPTSALDIHHQLRVLQKIVDYSKRHQCTTLMVIHDLGLALRFCQTLTLIHRGNVACHGAAHQVIADPMMSTVFGVGIESGTSPLGYRYLLPTQFLPTHGEKICIR